ncbi:polyprenyl diphosphate synthase [Candidatus Puniceispirillum marinum]|uniref:Isoprenyl transferase n=1 Tax=Puniceispirillum marinum (strain IMCC1322) TaxID=488538 RepID=D5BR61_PUNMI|nr:polyprenyl diphosphate synthase [Candidatus Puniceispirillum marinum]ADE38758.1 Di-trans-poly-cis-decaprenylcistransferase [Candidatus Puniceispirillum marinum IMCC1322]
MVKTPHHTAIIMDGNRRWAKGRGLDIIRGHNQGAESLKDVCRAAPQGQIRWLTAFAFSAQNWSRPEPEVSGLLKLMRLFLMREIEELIHNNIRLRVIGNRGNFSTDLQQLISKSETLTAENTGLNLTIALDFGGQQDITQATRQIAEEVAAGVIDPKLVNNDFLKSRLQTAVLPPVDLLIRTGGEKRISNFLLWDLSYAELYFSDTYWPDFKASDLEVAITEFNNRERRFGGNYADNDKNLSSASSDTT